MREGMGGREAYGEGWCRRGVVVWILYENTMIVASSTSAWVIRHRE